MADEEQTIVDGQDGGQAPKKGPSKLILFGGIGVVAIVIGIVLALFVISPMTSGGGDQAASEPAADQSTAGGHGESGGGDHGGSHGGSAAAAARGNIYSIDNIIVNPAGTGGSRFLSTSISFELKSNQLVKDFESRDAVIRDALITILSSKTVTQLTNPKQREITRYQIRKRVAQLLNTEDIEGVYYTDFVLQ
jgi:flagellar FliL protein